uniref:Uncharacterized protein n=1 Tax=Pipistrellus kuhlii TaxID=59472 RepID=A0A7J7XV34_PIPKU|nr:hypothetical protein mPipKuh1_010420 [Pipistrellus kuhlii]
MHKAALLRHKSHPPRFTQDYVPIFQPGLYFNPGKGCVPPGRGGLHGVLGGVLCGAIRAHRRAGGPSRGGDPPPPHPVFCYPLAILHVPPRLCPRSDVQRVCGCVCVCVCVCVSDPEGAPSLPLCSPGPQPPAGINQCIRSPPLGEPGAGRGVF